MDSIISFISSHSVILAGLVVGILDFIFAISPSLASNGILHAVYMWLKGLMAPKA